MVEVSFGGNEGIIVSRASADVVSTSDFAPYAENTFIKRVKDEVTIAIPRNDFTLLVKFSNA